MEHSLVTGGKLIFCGHNRQHNLIWYIRNHLAEKQNHWVNHWVCGSGIPLQWMKRQQDHFIRTSSSEKEIPHGLVVKSRFSFCESIIFLFFFFFLKLDFNIWFHYCSIHSKSYLEKWVPNVPCDIFNTFLEIHLQLCVLALLCINPKKIDNWVSLVICHLQIHTGPQDFCGKLWQVSSEDS